MQAAGQSVWAPAATGRARLALLRHAVLGQRLRPHRLIHSWVRSQTFAELLL